jgi:hypothetical protein
MTSSSIRKARLTGKGMIAATLVASALLVSAVSAQDGNRDLTNNSTGTHNGFYYSFWKDSGNVTFGLREGGRYTSQWSNINNWVGGKGWNPGGPRVVTYSGSYNVNNSQNSYLALYGWTRNPLIEYYVIESYGSYNPSSCTTGRQTYGSFQSDGATYDIVRCQRINQPSIDGTATFYQYFNVRNPKKGFGNISGTITVANHFNVWASKGLNLGTHNYMVLATEGYQSSGSSDITVGSSGGAQPTGCGTVGGVAVCCDISADPDGDGMGTENGKVCTVTQDTRGWHPPNPSDVLAAINVGGTGNSVAIGNIYYEPNTYVSGGTPNSTTDNISGGGGSEIYKSEIFGDFTVEIPMSNQRVSVELGFVEMFWNEAGQRSFNVAIENQTVLSNVDLYARVGHDVLWKPDPFVVDVNDGKLTIRVTTNRDNGTLSSVLVRKAAASSSSSSSSSSSTSSSSSSSTSSSSSSGSSGNVNNGRTQIRSALCSGCHVDSGNGVFTGAIPFNVNSLTKANTEAGLASFISSSMPSTNPSACTGSCATDIAAYLWSLRAGSSSSSSSASSSSSSSTSSASSSSSSSSSSSASSTSSSSSSSSSSSGGTGSNTGGSTDSGFLMMLGALFLLRRRLAAP